MPEFREFESIRKSLGLGRLTLALRIVVAGFAHAHLLTIPVFVLLLGVLYYLANWPSGSPTAQAMITALPMVALAADASLTWLVLATDWLVVPLLTTRAIFLLGILIQTVCTLGGLWQRE